MTLEQSTSLNTTTMETTVERLISLLFDKEAEIKELNERRGLVKLSELRKKDQEQKAKDKKKGNKEKAAKELAKERHAPHRSEAFHVLADLIRLRREVSAALPPR